MLFPSNSGFTFYPFYGCDRYVLAQVEVEGYFGVRIGGNRPLPGIRGVRLNLVPQWVLFFNTGRGWTKVGEPFGARDTDTEYDVGGGVSFGGIGIYAAYPLDEPDADVNFVVRLQRRF